MPPFIQCRQPPDDSWVTFDLGAGPQTIQVRQPPNFDWVPFTTGGAGWGNVLTFPNVAAMAAWPSSVAGLEAICLAEGLWFECKTTADTAIRNVIVTSTSHPTLQWHQNCAPNAVFVGPPSGGDDWPDLNLLMLHEAAGPQREINFAAGATYISATPGNVPARTVIVGNGATIVSTMAPHGDQSQCIFRAAPTNGVAAAALTTNAVVGEQHVHVDSVTDPVIAGGDVIYIGDASAGLHGQYYTVLSVATLVLNLDRPIQWAFPSATAGVVVNTTRPTQINIRNLTITGTGDRAIELIGAIDSSVEDVQVTSASGTFSDMGIAFDIGGFRCRVERCTSVGPAAGTTYGIAVESGEACRISESHSSLWNVGIMLLDSANCTIADCCTSGCVAYGTNLNNCDRCTVSGGDNSGIPSPIMIGSSRNCSVIGGAVKGGTGGNGGVNISASSDTLVSGVTLQANVNGILIAGTSPRVRIMSCAAKDNSSTDINAPSDVLIDGFTSEGCGFGSIYLSGAANHRVTVANAQITTKTGSATRAIYGAGGAGAVYTLSNVTIDNKTAGSLCIQAGTAGTVWILDNVAGVGTGGSSYGIYAAGTIAAVVRKVGRVDFSAMATPFDAGPVYGWGQVQLNGAATVDVAFADIKANEFPKLSLKTRGGTYGGAPDCAVTAGTKFSVTGQVLDTCTYFWEL